MTPDPRLALLVAVTSSLACGSQPAPPYEEAVKAAGATAAAADVPGAELATRVALGSLGAAGYRNPCCKENGAPCEGVQEFQRLQGHTDVMLCLGSDVDNCGAPGHDCRLPGNGLDDGAGRCMQSSCECDSDADCHLPGTNACVDRPSGFSACACADFEDEAGPAPCPRPPGCGDASCRLPCVPGGCLYRGEVFATRTALGELN